MSTGQIEEGKVELFGLVGRDSDELIVLDPLGCFLEPLLVL